MTKSRMARGFLAVVCVLSVLVVNGPLTHATVPPGCDVTVGDPRCVPAPPPPPQPPDYGVCAELGDPRCLEDAAKRPVPVTLIVQGVRHGDWEAWYDPKSDRIIGPIPDVVRALGLEWESVPKTANGTVTHGDKRLSLSVGNSTAYWNGGIFSLSGAPSVHNGRMYGPLRAVVEAFGAQVEYDENAKTYSIRLQPIQVFIDGQILATDVDPFMKNDRVLVPVRAISEALHAHVDWNAVNQVVTVTHEGFDGKNEQLLLFVDNPVARLSLIGFDGNPLPTESLNMGVTAQIVNGRTFIPLRVLAEFLNHKVEWDGANRRVLIDTHFDAQATLEAQHIVSKSDGAFDVARNGAGNTTLYPALLREAASVAAAMNKSVRSEYYRTLTHSVEPVTGRVRVTDRAAVPTPYADVYAQGYWVSWYMDQRAIGSYVAVIKEELNKAINDAAGGALKGVGIIGVGLIKQKIDWPRFAVTVLSGLPPVIQKHWKLEEAVSCVQMATDYAIKNGTDIQLGVVFDAKTEKVNCVPFYTDLYIDQKGDTPFAH